MFGAVLIAAVALCSTAFGQASLFDIGASQKVEFVNFELTQPRLVKDLQVEHEVAFTQFEIGDHKPMLQQAPQPMKPPIAPPQPTQKMIQAPPQYHQNYLAPARYEEVEVRRGVFRGGGLFGGRERRSARRSSRAGLFGFRSGGC